MANNEEYHVTLTCRSRLTLIRDIRDKIRNTPREESFRNTCFGWLLDLDQSQEILFLSLTWRRVFESGRDGKHITIGMLLEKINNKEFDSMNNDDVVGLCLLGILELVLLAHELRPHDARWTVAKSRTTSLHRGSNIFLLQTDRHLRGTLDGSTRPYPSWDVVDWVFMPIHAGVHGHPDAFFNAIRANMAFRLYECRCEDTTECGYD
ncbi:hypothetical protein Tco_0963501 [Tanacetum coccineum]